MDRCPLKPGAPAAQHAFGGRRTPERLGRAGLSLRDLAAERPDELVGRGWRGSRFPVLTEFIDSAGMPPVHLHADDETARRLEGGPERHRLLTGRPRALRQQLGAGARHTSAARGERSGPRHRPDGGRLRNGRVLSDMVVDGAPCSPEGVQVWPFMAISDVPAPGR